MGVTSAEEFAARRITLGFNTEGARIGTRCPRCHIVTDNECACPKQDDADTANDTKSSQKTDHLGLAAGQTSPYQRTLNLVPGFPEKALRRMVRAIDSATPEEIGATLADAKHVYDLLLFHRHEEQADVLKLVSLNYGSHHFDAPAMPIKKPEAENTVSSEPRRILPALAPAA
jgi:hypothetical protein